jgi:hypothetical protein
MNRKWTAYSTSIFALSKSFNKTSLMTLLIAVSLYMISGVSADEGVIHGVPADEGFIHGVPVDEGIVHGVPADEGVDSGVSADEGIVTEP